MNAYSKRYPGFYERRNPTRSVAFKAIFVSLFLFAASIAWARGSVDELPDLLVETNWLSENINHENLVIIDTGRSKEDYLAGHIPGAVIVTREEYYREVERLPGMFAGSDLVSEALRDAGVNNDSMVVLYDPGHGLWATRLFWTLELLGHENVAVLNGGITKWQADGFNVSTTIPTDIQRGTFAARYRPELIISGSDLADSLDDTIVVDTRSAAEYAGIDVRAARGGHIPGAVNIDWALNNTNDEVNSFLSVEELGEFYEAQLDGQEGKIVTHCQTGVRGAHTYFVLRLLGYDDIALYDGSWAEWGNIDSFPVDTP